MIEVLLMKPPDTDWRVYPTVFICCWGMLSLRNGFTRSSFIKSILVTTLFYFTPVLFCGIGFLLLALSIGWGYTRPPVIEQKEEAPLWDDPVVSMQEAEVIVINKNTKQINIRGRSFLLQMERNGFASIQELDRKGNRIGKPTRGTPSGLGDYFKRKINNR